MKFSQLFKVSKAEKENIISLDDFYLYLKKTDQKLKKSNFKRTLQTYPGGVLDSDGIDVVPVTSVLCYSFQHREKSKACAYITKTVENELLREKESESSSLELYKLIAKTNIHHSSPLFYSIEVNENTIDTLLVEHKPLFTSEEWTKICWFEYHFSKSSSYLFDLNYENLLSLKFAKFQSLLSLQDICNRWNTTSKRQIKEKFSRYQTAEAENQVTISAGKAHVPAKLEDDLITLFELYYPDIVEYVTCFDITSSSVNKSIQVVVCDSKQQLFKDDDLCARAFYNIKRKHDVLIEKIYFCDISAIQQFICEDDTISRFQLRDEVETKGIKCSRIWCAQSVTCSEIQEVDSDCISCFPGCQIKPLNINSFNIIQEWYLETPIETQILLEGFVNKRSVRKNKNPEQFYQHKLEKLYNIYDVLLHLHNIKYAGIFQKCNTNELLVEYKSINSVFDITSAYGTTTSLKTAENQLKKNANLDLCYYNTYLKHHELRYLTISGDVKDLICLRQCHLILMLDNLVRLRYVADPTPGENRSKQICTLPITLQGLPLDHSVTESWHLADCDASVKCLCKHQDHLKQNDVEGVLLQLKENERRALDNFSKLMTFGPMTLWKKLPDDLLSQVDGNSEAGKQCQGNEHRSDGRDGEHSVALENEDGHENRPEEDIDLEELLELVSTENCDDEDLETIQVGSYSSDEDVQNVSGLETSFCQMSILSSDQENETGETIQELLQSFGFTKFKVPPLLCRHPPPATGRDDDITKIREILDDVLLKMGYESDQCKLSNRILCGPDNKIGKCIFRLMENNPKYRVFLPEFPLLHLRKSMITILFSSYKEAGLVEILKFMREEDHDEWTKLVSIQGIDKATRYVRRIALALHLAFLNIFAQSLNNDELEAFMDEMESAERSSLSEMWFAKFEKFVEFGASQNATFALHVDIMRHCDNVIAVALAERLGGPDGYSLLLAAVKGSLLFSFVNNASSYAPYCVKLLYEHYSAGHYHRHMKETLFSTPFKSSDRNFACDTKREMDHLDVLKGFRSGSNVSTVTCRMSLVDSLNETRQQRQCEETKKDDDRLGWELTSVDEAHIFPATTLMLRRNGLSTEENDTPFNVYTKDPLVLPISILDMYSDGTAKFLLIRYLAKEKLFNLTENDLPTADQIQGPKDLVSRAKRSTGVTLRRTLKSKVRTVKSERQSKEENRQKGVAKEAKLIDCLSSENNACQALLKADSSKPKVMKAVGMQRALRNLVSSCMKSSPTEHTLEHFLDLSLTSIPKHISQSMKVCTVEFAGVKFKLGNVKSGKEYIQVVESMMRKYLKHADNISTFVICEEKYSFTPDDLKASTRQQRQRSTKQRDVDHLKHSTTFLNENTFNKDVITKSEAGKRAISTYLAENSTSLVLDRDIKVVIDSELYKSKQCSDTPHPCITNSGHCDCKEFCTPISVQYSRHSYTDTPCQTKVSLVKQCKGEAEMAVLDWLVYYQDALQVGDSAICLVTSGDIDAIFVHLFALNLFWKRDESGKFKNNVYIVLQKPYSKSDIYNITAMLELFEECFQDNMIGCKIAIALCIGGNDFIPKPYQLSHDTILKHMLENPHYRKNLISFANEKVQLNSECFVEFYKSLFCPKRLQNLKLPYDEVRAVTIRKTQDKNKSGFKTSDPRKWLPPRSATERLGNLIQLQIDYLCTAGTHDAPLPDFLGSNCLKRNSSGEIEYDFGPESCFGCLTDLPEVQMKLNKKRGLENTPQSGARRKRPLTSTPDPKRQMKK